MPAPTDKSDKTNYIAVLQQAADGCDYTIACGTRLVLLEATTPNGALAECKGLLAEYSGEQALRSMTLFETTRSLNVPVDQFYKELAADAASTAAAEAAALEEAQARKQLADLQARFGT